MINDWTVDEDVIKEAECLCSTVLRHTAQCIICGMLIVQIFGPIKDTDQATEPPYEPAEQLFKQAVISYAALLLAAQTVLQFA